MRSATLGTAPNPRVARLLHEASIRSGRRRWLRWLGAPVVLHADYTRKITHHRRSDTYWARIVKNAKRKKLGKRRDKNPLYLRRKSIRFTARGLDAKFIGLRGSPDRRRFVSQGFSLGQPWPSHGEGTA